MFLHDLSLDCLTAIAVAVAAAAAGSAAQCTWIGRGTYFVYTSRIV